MSIQRETSSVGAPGLRDSGLASRSPNRLLASLPSEEYERLAPHLTRMPMRSQEILHKQESPIDAVYFPGGGACALVKKTEDGRTMEIGAVGAEGATVFFGLSHAPCDVVVQLMGPHVDVMPLEVLTREMERRGALYDRINSYSYALVSQLMQLTACSCLHSAEQRCARWLLAAHDRAGRDEFRFTHDFVATMLGLRRPTVTIVMASLKAAGVIAHHQRATVTILDRAGLERMSCECYQVMRSTLKRLLSNRSAPVTDLAVQ